jgi:hypothetical protein
VRPLDGNVSGQFAYDHEAGPLRPSECEPSAWTIQERLNHELALFITARHPPETPTEDEKFFPSREERRLRSFIPRARGLCGNALQESQQRSCGDEG